LDVKNIFGGLHTEHRWRCSLKDVERAESAKPATIVGPVIF
jgi:hypothetical protein